MHSRLSHIVLSIILTSLAAPGSAMPIGESPSVTGEGLAGMVKPDFGRVALMANEMAAELQRACPFADPASEKSFKACAEKLYANSALRRHLPDYVLWGRLLDEKSSLKETYLTQFGQDVFTAAYMPLFMFNGDYEIKYDENEKLYKIEFVTAFRNRLTPGMFPYPFWHNENKWMVYQGANRITVWVGVDRRAQTEKIKVMQFSTLGKNHAATPSPIPLPAFDKETQGKWLWTDADGKTQPQVTLFDGLYDRNNPHLKRLDETYRSMALELRKSECMNCHVPNNPDKMKRLVLLQTPIHAASEIGRLIRDVREDRMPLDETGIEKPMPTAAKNVLLTKAEAFQAAIRVAKAWETQNAKK